MPSTNPVPSRAASAARRVAGGTLILLTVLPLHRLLAHPGTGLAGEATVRTMEAYGGFLIWGTVLVGLAAVAGGVAPLDVAGRVRRAAVLLERVPGVAFAGVLAGVSAALTLLFTMVVLDGQPNAVDSVVQVLHARFWSEGRLAGPAAGAEFWTLQNALVTPRGWVSQYPPGHVAVLAAALALGALPLAGAFMVGLTVFCGTLLTLRLHGRDPVVGRLAGLLLALCPFLLFLGGSYMNHVTAGAFVTLAAYALFRAWEGPRGGGWAALAGFAFSWALATRPLSTVAMAAALSISLPFAAGIGGLRAGWPRAARVLAFVAAGALPLTAAFLAYNAWFFGHPLRTGYEVAAGPEVGLGFGTDPWGNVFGVREALAWTAADLRALSVHLFETPLPAVGVIGAYLLIARRLGPAVRVYLAWAGAPLVANAFYWHHGIYMGPRMLHEAAPAWALLFAVSAVGLVRHVPAGARVLGRLRAREAVALALVGSVALGLAVLAPIRGGTYGPDPAAAAGRSLPDAPVPALVFVHDAWPGRIAMTLAARGFRLDQVETLLRQNATCAVDALAAAAAGGDTARVRAIWATMDTVPRAHDLPARAAVAPGYLIRVLPGEVPTPDCLRQARSDRFGVVDLAPFTWRGDLPGGAARGTLYLRDLGPERNAVAVALHPRRELWVHAFVDPSAAPVLLPYEEAMRLLWGGEDGGEASRP